MTVTEPGLWDDPPAPTIPSPPPEQFARRSDPDTSRAAAQSMGDSLGPLTQWVLATVIECARTDPWRLGTTAAEAMHRMGYDGRRVPETGSICRRFTTLARAGFVRDTGERRRSGAGRDQIAWAATSEGRSWLAALTVEKGET